MAELTDLLGKVLTKVEYDYDHERITFECEDGTKYLMYHEQDCCESVYVESIIGDLEDLVGYPVLLADKRTQTGTDVKWDDSYTWTFYTFATVKGYVDIRWNGSSNGYYSESVDFIGVYDGE